MIGCEIMRIFSSDSEYLINTHSVGWVTELQKSYKSDWFDTTAFIENFKSIYSILPLIRRMSNASANSVVKSADLLTFCAIITDRRLLAEQTRDIFAEQPNQSRIATKAGYIPAISRHECHERCKNIALSRNKALWTSLLKDGKRFELLGELLDEIYAICKKHRKTPSQVIEFPDINDISKIAYHQDDDIFPDKYEQAWCERVIISLKKGELNPITVFLDEHIQNIHLNEPEMIFFLRYVLKVYCVQDHAFRSTAPGKHYESKIAASDVPALGQQAQECFEVYVYFDMLYSCTQPIKKKAYVSDDIALKIQNALINHDKVCHSCRINRSTHDEPSMDLEDYCLDFASRISEYWDVLGKNPFLIYRLWTNNVQNAFATSRKSLKAALTEACRSYEFSLNSETVRANHELYQSLLNICFPNSFDHGSEMVRHIFHQLYCELETSDDAGYFPEILEILTQKVKYHIEKCLSFRVTDLRIDCPVPLVTQGVLEEWLSDAASGFSKLNTVLTSFSPKEYTRLKKSFRNSFENPTETNIQSWENDQKRVSEKIVWEQIFDSCPETVFGYSLSPKMMSRFAVAWTLLQDLIKDAKKQLWDIYYRILEALE